MKFYDNELVVTFDIDDTLVLHKSKLPRLSFRDPYNKRILKLTPHKKHIDLLKQFKHRGYLIIVWSGGGSKWANAVVKRLGLERYVDLVLTKPIKVVDDLPVQEWMGSRIYLPL